jgi:hypothetical protein
MPTIFINRPPRTAAGGRSMEVSSNADVSIVSGGVQVDLPNSENVLIVMTKDQTGIYTDQEALDQLKLLTE